MPETMDTRLSRLRERAERALASGRRGGDVLTVLETMTREAPDGSAHALFAHRHLAELQLSGSPWRAALHLRRLVQAGAADDSAHALMGLSQALLGNYRTAVASYRRAIKLAPKNPWYHHNLGHLLDVGLSDSTAALDHLRIAQRIQPEEDEIAASLAHCLARVGQLKEAEAMAQQAVRRSPRNREHLALLEWIRSGAPSNITPSARPERRSGRAPSEPSAQSQSASVSPVSGARGARDARDEADHAEQAEQAERAEPADVDGTGETPASPASSAHLERVGAGAGAGPSHGSRQSLRAAPHAPSGADPVLSLLEAHNHAQADAQQRLQSARSLWTDFCAMRSPRVPKPAVYAAAIEYTLARLTGARSVTQAELARRYNVTARAIASRHEEIRLALAIEPNDPRYCK